MSGSLDYHLGYETILILSEGSSTVKTDTLNPVWNESWNVKNVPSDAVLTVKVLDKDDGSPTDDYIGKFETTISPGPKEVEIIGMIFKQVKGTFWMNVSQVLLYRVSSRR